MSRPSLALACATLLAACGASEDVPEAVETPVETLTPQLAVTVSDHFPGVGGRIVAMAALPQDPPWASRVLAALETGRGGALAVTDLAASVISLTEFPRIGSLITAPEFELRGLAAPLVLAAGGELDAVQVYWYLANDDAANELFSEDAGAGASLTAVPTTPIAPDLDVSLICPVRATDAVVEFIVVDGDYAETWRLRDTGEEMLTAERVDAAAHAAGATACGPRPGSRALILDSAGRLEAGSRGFNAAAMVDVDQDMVAQLAIAAPREEAGFIIIDADSAQTVAQLDIEGGLNTPELGDADVLMASAASFGGSYNRGLLAVAQGDALSIIALDTLNEALDALP